MTWLI
jgi:glyceraldehyde 3-phosphate dehydrogenase